MRRRFFVRQFANGKATLEGDAAHHLGRVLRAEPGQLYELSDGRGVNLARVERVGRDAVEFTILEPLAVRAPRLEIALLVAVIKFDHFEWALEKATELGVSAIVPLAAARSDKSLLTAAPKRAERWRKILLESAQQARCLRPPTLEELTSPAEAFRAAPRESESSAKASSAQILLSERPGAAPLRAALQDAASREAASARRPMQLLLAIGPEGGWTEEEFAAAAAAKFREAAIGENILRTETAVVAALAAAHLFLE